MILNMNSKMISLYVPGIKSFEKWKALFQWLKKENADIIFLHETYSIPEVELAVEGRDVFWTWHNK